MRVRPWKLSEGFLIGGVIIVAGLALQLTLGPIKWSALVMPAGLIVLVLLMALLSGMYLLRKRVYAFEWMMHSQAAVSSIACALGLTMVMGLIPQSREVGVPWLFRMLTFWPFALIWAWMMVVSGLATINHFLRFKLKEIPFLLNHLGVFLTIVAATLGCAEVQKLQMTVYYDSPERMAISDDGVTVEPGFSVELHAFTIDYYEDLTPRRFASDISVKTEDGAILRGEVEVNKPMKVNGWKIYQSGYDVRMGDKSPYSVLMLVKDPSLPAVYTGIFLMLAGAVSLLIIRRYPKRKFVLLASLLLTIFFTFLTVSRMGPSARSLPPALQSPWFIPHLIVYMAGYALLATATLMAIYILFFGKDKVTDREINITDNLVYAGLAFLTVGMLFGALWAKQAWGHYWTWDPKETWAAITWLCYLLYLHFRTARPKEWRDACWILLLAFVCLQICWWGINYLPSAQGMSIHTYTSH